MLQQRSLIRLRLSTYHSMKYSIIRRLWLEFHRQATITSRSILIRILASHRPAVTMPKRSAAKKVTKTPNPEETPAKKQKLEIPEGKLTNFLTDPGWKSALSEEFEKEYFKKIEEFLEKEYAAGKEVFPPKELIFNAFNLTPFSEVKAVILGQDPYHDNGQAHGLCFSVAPGVKPPPSLKNMYKELKTDIPGFVEPDHGHLEAWAKRGVLLLNATLTVEAHKANSHSKIGWQTLTDAAIKAVSDQTKGLVFILWGGFAQKKSALIDAEKHAVIKAAHPSPLSVTKFLGCKCFSAANEYLKKFGKSEINWSLPIDKKQPSIAQFVKKL